MSFLPGNPGYQTYEDIAYMFGAAVCWSAVAFFAIRLRNNPRDVGRIALITSFVLEAIGYTLDPPSVVKAISAWSGTPNAAGLIIIIVTILWCVAVIIALSCWHDSPQQRKKTARVWLCSAAVPIVAVVVVWFRGSLLRAFVSRPTKIGTNAADIDTNGWAAATMIIYAVAIIIGLVKIRSLCVRYATSSQKSWVTRGLTLVRWGADINLGYTCVFLVGATIPYWYAVTVPAVITSTILIVAGFTLPLLGPGLINIRRDLADIRAHRALEPLWEDIVLSNPHIALRESDRRKIGYRLYRRVVEIRNGITHLSEFITDDETPADGSDPARTAAQQLRRAMTEKTVHRGTDYSDGFALLAGDNPNASIDEEIRWLCQLAKRYAQLDKKTPPT